MPPITDNAAPIFHNSKDSLDTFKLISIPKIGTNKVNGAIIVIEYFLLNNQGPSRKTKQSSWVNNIKYCKQRYPCPMEILYILIDQNH